MGFSARSRLVQRVLVLFALAGTGLVLSTNTLSTFQSPKAILVVTAGALVAVLGAARVAVTGEVRLRHRELLGAAGAFVLLAVVASFVSDAPAMSIAGEYDRQTGLVVYAAYFALLSATVVTFDVDVVRQVAAALLGAAGVAAVYGLLQVLDLDPLDYGGQYSEAVFSTLGNPNWAGAYTGLAVPVAAWVVLSRRWPTWARAGAGAVGVLALGVSAATRSLQGPLVAMAGLGVVTIAWLLGRGGVWRERVAPALAGAGGLGAVLLGLGIFSMGPLAAIGAQQSVELRKLYWSTAWNMFTDRPLTGVGFDLYGSYFLTYRPAEVVQYDPRLAVDAPHSVPLDMFASGGILLGVAYLAVVGVVGWLLVRGLLRHQGERLLLLGGLGGAWLGYQAQSLVSIDVPSLAAAHWILAGAVAVAAQGEEPTVVNLPWGGTRRRRGGRADARERAVWIAAVVVAFAALVLAGRAWTADVAARDAEQLRLGGQFAAAVERGQIATGRAPWYPEYWLALGKALDSAGEPEAALTSFERALELDPRAVDPHLWAARIHEERGDQEAARLEYDAALAAADENPIVLGEVGQYLLRRGAFEEASPLLRRAVELEPDGAVYHLLLGQALAELGDPAARASLERALELANDGNVEPTDERVADAARAALDDLDSGGGG